MLVLITYDVNTETKAGKADYGRLQNNVLITEHGFNILFLSVFWIMLNSLCLNRY